MNKLAEVKTGATDRIDALKNAIGSGDAVEQKPSQVASGILKKDPPEK